MNNDLIGRNALLKELDEYNESALFDCEAVKDLINDVPIVSDRYDEGYAQGYVDGSTGADWRGAEE